MPRDGELSYASFQRSIWILQWRKSRDRCVDGGDAEALVDYLLSLKGANYSLPEAPVNQPFTSSLPDPAPAPVKEAAKTTQPVEADK